MDIIKSVDTLLHYLLDEMGKAGSIPIPSDYEEKMTLLRALMNVWSPDSVDPIMLVLQDEILEFQRSRKTIIDPYSLETVKEAFDESEIPFTDKLVLWRGDITTLKADAIVNAANSKLLGCFAPLHRCIDNAIHSAAGIQLRLACKALMEKQGADEPPGFANITEAYSLPAKYVIHTVGPIIYDSVTDEDCRLLEQCYSSCLELTKEYSDIRTIAFCCISTGEYRFPKDRAAQIAVSSVCEWLESDRKTVDRIIFNVFTREDYDEYSNIFKQHHKNN